MDAKILKTRQSSPEDYAQCVRYEESHKWHKWLILLIVLLLISMLIVNFLLLSCRSDLDSKRKSNGVAYDSQDDFAGRLADKQDWQYYLSIDDRSSRLKSTGEDMTDGVHAISNLDNLIDDKSASPFEHQNIHNRRNVKEDLSDSIIKRETRRRREIKGVKKILVTGGAGFIGSNLVDDLMREGHNITVIDNLSTGLASNLADWMQNKSFKLIHRDVSEPMDYDVDEIYHLASPASPKNYMKDPLATIRANTEGTVNVLELAKRTGARVIIASTSEVYGDPLVHPQPESYNGNVNPIGPRSCYDESKRLSETLAIAYHTSKNVSVGIARIFNTYGPRLTPTDGRVISNFVFNALKNRTLELYGSGKQSRSFMHVDDLIKGLKSLMSSNLTYPVNIGNPEELTIKNLANIIKMRIPYCDSRIKTSDYVIVDDPQRRRPNIDLAKAKLGWEPKIKFTDGLDKFISYYERSVICQDNHDTNLENANGMSSAIIVVDKK